jgi:hypothetical protein
MALPIGAGVSFGFFPTYGTLKDSSNTYYLTPPPPNDPGWFEITEHNRQPFEIGYDNVEKDVRMANGFMRKFVVAQKKTISVSWDTVPSVASVSNLIRGASATSGADPSYADALTINLTVDGRAGGDWLKKFYESNIFIPLWIKVVHSTASVAQGGSYATGFTPSVNYSSQMNSSSAFLNYPTLANPNFVPTLQAQPEIFYGFMTDFSYNVQKRYTYTDLVNMSIKFVEA